MDQEVCQGGEGLSSNYVVVLRGQEKVQVAMVPVFLIGRNLGVFVQLCIQCAEEGTSGVPVEG